MSTYHLIFAQGELPDGYANKSRSAAFELEMSDDVANDLAQALFEMIAPTANENTEMDEGAKEYMDAIRTSDPGE